MGTVNSTQPIPAGELKVCTKCSEAKARTEFHVGREYPDGRKATCKVCMQVQRRAKYHSQRESEVAKRRARKATEEWRALKPEREAAAKARLLKRIAKGAPEHRYCTACTTVLPATLIYFNRSTKGSYGLTASCKECLRKAYALRSKSDREKLNAQARESYLRNAPRKLALQKIKRRTDPAFAIRMRVSSSVRNSLGKTKLGTSWIRLLDFSAQDLRDHLEQQFAEGMTWAHFMAGEIEIDHVIPVSFFRPTAVDSIEFRMCWNLKNLQPLWRSDNRQKSDTLPANFPELWNELYYEATQYAA